MKLVKNILLFDFRDVHDDFRAKIRDYNGPRVVTKILRGLCGLPSNSKIHAMKCKDFSILPLETFYALSFDDVRHNVNLVETSKRMMEKLKHSHGMHLWNVISKVRKMNLSPGSALDLSMKAHCPRTYARFKVY